MREAARDLGRPRRRPERLRQSVFRRRRRLRGSVLTEGRRILGVDPGTRCAGWAVVAGSVHRPQLIACGEIRLPDRMAMADRLARLHTGISAVVSEHAPTEAAVEATFHGASARSALQLAHARGVVLAVLGIARLPVFEYSPATIKRAVTGNGRAEKEQVEVMVSRLVTGGCPSGRLDIADAIAAAICHLFGTAHADALRRADASRRDRSPEPRRP